MYDFKHFFTEKMAWKFNNEFNAIDFSEETTVCINANVLI